MKIIMIAAVMMALTGSVNAASFNDLGVRAADLQALAAAEGFAVPAVPAENAAAVLPFKAVEWVTIPGGAFNMGDIAFTKRLDGAKPRHEVTIKTFDMAKTPVTVEQYAQCVDKGLCTEPEGAQWPYSASYAGCNWGVAGQELHPMNCVNWDQANQYARFMGARLPSESEWEYAATSGGNDQRYPWGNEAPACDQTGNGILGCGKTGTLPVCSKPAGNTRQGLCDMSGNVWQWVQDKYKRSYRGVPADGSAFEGEEGIGDLRVVRGETLSNFRSYTGADKGNSLLGFRLARTR